MKLLITVATCSAAAVGIWYLRGQLLLVGRVILAGVFEFRRHLKEIDEDLWR